MTNTIKMKMFDLAAVDQDKVDFHAMYAEGYRVVAIRKSVCYYDAGHRAYRLAPDADYERFSEAAREAGLVVMAYAFWCYHAGAPSAAEQVANLIAAPGSIIPHVDIAPCTDVEFPGRGIADTGLTQGQAYTFTLELISEMEKQLGCKPVVYTSHVEWHDSNGLGGPKDLGGHDCPLWIKVPYPVEAGHAEVDSAAAREPHFGPAAWDKGDLWRVPTPWEKDGWWIRQYQGDASGDPGVQGRIDLDDFCALDCRAAGAAADPRAGWVARKLGLAAGFDDAALLEAVKEAQRAHDLEDDGIVGPRTFAALSWL